MIPRQRQRPRKISAPRCLHVTPHIIRAAYDMLLVTPPFQKWKLPPGESIVFRATPGRDWAGQFLHSPLEIGVAVNQCGQLTTLLPLLAHEIVHLRQHLLGSPVTHGALFRKLASQICRNHGWDLKAF